MVNHSIPMNGKNIKLKKQRHLWLFIKTHILNEIDVHILRI